MVIPSEDFVFEKWKDVGISVWALKREYLEEDRGATSLGKLLFVNIK